MILKAPERGKKISEGIVRQIRDAVLSGELKLGDKIGSEKDLMAQLNVSKGTLREALRVLEAMGFVEIRKGLSGGVFIAEVDMKTTLAGIMNLLSFQSVSIRDITMVRYILEPAILEIAFPLVTRADLKQIDAVIESESEPEAGSPFRGIGFHRYLARITHNPILILVMDFIDNLVADIKIKEGLGADFFAVVNKHHRKILEDLRRGDLNGAVAAVKEDILFVGRHIAERLNAPVFAPAAETGASLADAPTAGTSGREAGKSQASQSQQRKAGAKARTPNAAASRLVLRDVASGQIYVLEQVKKSPT